MKSSSDFEPKVVQVQFQVEAGGFMLGDVIVQHDPDATEPTEDLHFVVPARYALKQATFISSFNHLYSLQGVYGPSVNEYH